MKCYSAFILICGDINYQDLNYLFSQWIPDQFEYDKNQYKLWSWVIQIKSLSDVLKTEMRSWRYKFIFDNIYRVHVWFEIYLFTNFDFRINLFLKMKSSHSIHIMSLKTVFNWIKFNLDSEIFLLKTCLINQIR